jgi:hypothetical protein
MNRVPIPQEEIDRLESAITEAEAFAQMGAPASGYGWLARERLRVLDLPGPWAQELAQRYQEALDAYMARHFQPRADIGRAEREERRETAWHEAGHVVAAALLGIQVGFASVEADAESLGRWAGTGAEHPVLDPAAAYWSHTERQLIVDLAGLQAQRLMNPAAPARDGRTDERLARSVEEVIGELPEGNTDWQKARLWAKARRAVLAYAQVRAAEWVAAHRPVIEAVANALLDQGRLTGAEIEAIMRAVMQDD